MEQEVGAPGALGNARDPPRQPRRLNAPRRAWGAWRQRFGWESYAPEHRERMGLPGSHGSA
eukprot:5521568-Pyramimonas_sp.AAC.1